MAIRYVLTTCLLAELCSSPIMAQSGAPGPGTRADAIAQFDRAVVLHDGGDLDAAIAGYRQAIKSDPTYAKAHNNLANALVDKGQIAAAIAEYRTAIQWQPDYAMAYYNLGSTYLETGDRANAARAFRSACSIVPGNVRYCNAADDATRAASSSPAQRAPSPARAGSSASTLVGTTWFGNDSTEYRFFEGGRARIISSLGDSTAGVWRQTGINLYLEVNGGYLKIRAVISGNRMTGEATNPVATLKWTADKQPPGAPTKIALLFERFYVALTGDGVPVQRVRADQPFFIVFDIKFSKPGPIDISYQLPKSHRMLLKDSKRIVMTASQAPGRIQPAYRVTLPAGEYDITGTVERDHNTTDILTTHLTVYR